MRTRIKICGLTRPADARTAIDAGVDALGLIFYRPSPRAVDVSTAAEIAADVPAFTAVVGVFVNASPQEIEEVLAKVRVTCLQFHGDEPAEDCEQYGVPYIKTVRMQDGVVPTEIARSHPAARAILLDSYHPRKYGGPSGSPCKRRVWMTCPQGGIFSSCKVCSTSWAAERPKAGLRSYWNWRD